MKDFDFNHAFLSALTKPENQRAEYWELVQKECGYSKEVFFTALNNIRKDYKQKLEFEAQQWQAWGNQPGAISLPASELLAFHTGRFGTPELDELTSALTKYGEKTFPAPPLKLADVFVDEKKYSLSLELLEDLGITLNGVCQLNGQGVRLWAAIIRMKLAGFFKDMPEQKLLPYFNSHLGTDFKKSNKTGPVYQEAFDDADRFLRNNK